MKPEVLIVLSSVSGPAGVVFSLECTFTCRRYNRVIPPIIIVSMGIEYRETVDAILGPLTPID